MMDHHDGFGSPGNQADDNSQLVALMLRVREHDEAAFRELVEATEDRLFGGIVKFLGSVEGAEDLAQKVYLRIWQARERYEPTAKFTTWMFSIAHRLVLNERRGLARRSAVFSSYAHEHLPEAVASDSPENNASAQELEQAIDAALRSLPDDQRAAIVLRRYEQMPYEEIALVLGTTLPAVKSLLFRARESLKAKLATWM
jgi:RNA polymerase sigma-70 factor (ECF subfamily)